ncbi:MAG: transporter substrate-binding domain-containing protein [Pseudomonadota bacterium]
MFIRSLRLTLALMLGAAFPAWAGQAPQHITVENGADPYSRPDGSGYANDVVRAAFAAVGVSIVFDVVPYARCKQGVLSARSATCVSMSWDPAFEGKIRFADTPLITITPVYFENGERPLVARSEAQLGAGLRIGTVRGYEYPPAAMRTRARGAVFEEGQSELSNLKKLAAGRLDAALVMSNPLTGVAHWAEAAEVGARVRLAFRSEESEYGYFAVSVEHPDGLALLEKYNAGIKRINGDGTVARLKSKWAKGHP